MRIAPTLDAAPVPASTRRFATLSLGFALGGFFDGIVLHQVLQWHHLLSGLDAPGLADPRVQVLADGLFHAAMYVIAALAIASLLRPGPRPGGLRTGGLVLIGFAAWHAVDSVLSHWLLGLHRIRMDTDSPLAWDLGWLLVFGAMPAAIGAWWARAGRGGGGPGGRVAAHAGVVAGADAAGGAGDRPATARASLRRAGRAGPALAWAAVAVAAGWVAARPPAPAADGTRPVTAVLASADDAARLLSALPPGAAIVGSDRAGLLWHLRLPADASGLRLVGRGAVWVAGSAATPGCPAWTAPPAPPAT